MNGHCHHFFQITSPLFCFVILILLPPFLLLPLFLQQVKTWQWLFLKEKEKGSDTMALRYLLSSIEEISSYRSYLKLNYSGNYESDERNDIIEEMMGLKDSLHFELVRLKCEKTLCALDAAIQLIFASSPSYSSKEHNNSTSNNNRSKTMSTSIPSYTSLLLPYIDSPTLLLKRAFILSIEYAWNEQLRAQKDMGREVSRAGGKGGGGEEEGRLYVINGNSYCELLLHPFVFCLISLLFNIITSLHCIILGVMLSRHHIPPSGSLCAHLPSSHR